jgi:hypothetical protein
MKIYLLALCMGIAVFSNSQNKVNQPDSAVKKHGNCMVYLDKGWKEVADSNTAVFCRYAYFDNGINTQPMDQCGPGWDFVKANGNTAPTNNKRLLNGIYTWTDYRGYTRCIASFENGQAIYIKRLYVSGSTQTYYDYTKQWNGQEHSYFITSYDQNGIATYSYWRKGLDGWGALASTKDGK